MTFGLEPLCNKRPETAPHLGAFCFPICWRCTALIIGVVCGFMIKRFIEDNRTFVMSLSIIAILPCLVDGLRQRFSDYDSTNIRRIIYGYVAGIGMRLFFYACGW